VRVVLLVDDDRTELNLMTRALLLGGYAVHAATDGSTAQEIAEALPSPPDLVVTDLRMQPMDGMTLASLLLGAGRASRFLFVSGYGTSADYDPNLGPLLPKPFSPDQLVQEVNRLLF
jgi:CheY-like chemotaxis protein